MALRRRRYNQATPRKDKLSRSEFLRRHVREVIDLVAELQQSLAASKGENKKPAAKSKAKPAAKTHKKAA